MPISDIEPGAVLARDLKDLSGSLILAKGGSLSKSMLGRLSSMNIKEAAIEGEDPDAAEKAREKLDALRHRFEGHEKDPFMSEMECIVRDHLEQIFSKEHTDVKQPDEDSS